MQRMLAEAVENLEIFYPDVCVWLSNQLEQWSKFTVLDRDAQDINIKGVE